MTKIKICGIQTPEDLVYATAYGADYVGFVFAKSKRKISAQDAQTLVKLVPHPVKTVGVVVSPSIKELRDIQRIISLDFWQIHGEIPSPYPKDLAPYIVATTADDISYLTPYDQVLVDAKQSGHGICFDWDTLDISKVRAKEVWIAGGLNAENVNEAIQHFHPTVVDVSSGVETNEKKDPKKIRAFCQAVKEETYVQSTQ
ncbi:MULTISPECIES: phosphoribosylanthranilate isomerase [Enterococcus]|uniref:N-(5'-phosphoribosyl)anthranilate isomerase n=1 Tax=Enterococcus sulfureus ATCC 49903 TaxID=1140003 RepID=S0PG73_9ENTE|nr:phosphoribosylanthranilate isomerase [Enterococcus sulfureus]EOT49549.1 hypothetical protein OMY_00477 [Enterococcus sulfureus ATCC 49903]EOT87416.1 hypothetical protein I573_00472 [Enterococcus sulfureus ATCC 49903]